MTRSHLEEARRSRARLRNIAQPELLPDAPIVELSGAEVVVRTLRAEGVDVVFGHPGGAIMPIYDALYQQPIRHLLARHEQGAVHAADGYARATGRVGVCMATSGPGATNLVTGLANAMMDSIPLVAITGQVPSRLIGTDAFQETDVMGVTYSVTKHSAQVRDPRRIAAELRRAFEIARSGRPGPVLVDLPKDVTLARVVEAPSEMDLVTGAAAAARDQGDRVVDGWRRAAHPSDIEAALQLLLSAERPLILVGAGVKLSGAWGEMRELVRRTGIPAVATLNALGCLTRSEPLYFGMVGMHGLRACNLATHACDVLFAVGARFDDRVTGNVQGFAPAAKKIHLDVDPAEIGKICHADVALLGDARATLREMLDALPACPDARYVPWVSRLRGWEREGAHTLTPVSGTPTVDPRSLMHSLAEVLYERDESAIVATDVGQHQMWAAQFLPISHPRAFLTSGGLGAMGYGLPAALGAQVAFPERTVVVVTGDGSFQMCVQEMITAVEYGLPVKVIVLNNGFLGMVRQWQELFHNRRYSCTALFNPDFAAVARAYGWEGERVQAAAGPAALRDALERCLAAAGPALLDCHVTAEANVYPMVPAGGANHEMLDEEAPLAAAV
jgi:acetolactate synthase-1/2/3 large subunit